MSTNNIECWRGSEATGTLIHLYEYKTARSLCKTIWRFLIKVNVHLDPFYLWVFFQQKCVPVPTKDIWKTFVTLATLKCFEKKKSNSSYLTPTSLGKGSIIATLYSCKERSIWWLLLQLPKDCKCSLRLCLLPSGTRDGDRRWSCSCKWYREGTCPVKLFPAPSFICFI